MALLALFFVAAPAIVPPPAQAQAADDAGQTPCMAPLNPDFVAYQASRTPIMLASPGPGGLVPAPVDLSYLKGKSLSWPGMTSDLPASYLAMGGELPEVLGFPATYDLRGLGKLTGIRNQGSSGSCWAFATYSSLESYLLPGASSDFSENNLKNTHGFDVGPNDGGNMDMSTAYLVRWGGPVNETDDPYVPTSTSSPVLPAAMHVQDVLYIPDRANSTDNDNLKQMIQAYGAVYTSMYWSDSYYNAPNRSYYYNGGGSNHAIALVGWNDSYSRSKFTTQPPGDGAFIVRNSWGSWWGESGYFYISYYDSIIGHSNAVFTAEPASNYDHIYQYDPLGWTFSTGYPSTDTAWMAASYTASGNESLAAVGFYALDVNTEYLVNVLRNGVLVASASKSGTIGVPGYHTIRLDSPVSLSAGNSFQVRVRLRTPGTNYPIAVEAPWGYCSQARANATETYISSNGAAWTDLTSLYSNSNACLKAYTITSGGGPQPPDWPSLGFAAPSYSISEGGGTVTISVVRSGNLSPSSSVSYSVTGGNATAGADYTGGSGSLAFAAGAATATFNVNIVNDAACEKDENIVISLSSPVNATIGSPGNTTITIQNNDPAPSIQFSAATYTINENGGTLAVPVNLAGTTSLPSSVGYSVSGGNATAGADYTGGTGTLSYPAGTTTASFNINIVNDAVCERNETIVLALSSPVNATLGANASATITIRNDDPAPAASFNYSMKAGWNLVSMPLVPGNDSITAVIPPEAMKNITIVWHYDNLGTSPVWKFYKPGRAVNTLANITGGMGFWVLATANVNFTVNGTLPAEDDITIRPGWNMVGLRSLTNRTPAEAYGSYYLTWGYNGSWYFYKPSRTANTLDEIRPGSGYWVLMN